MTVSVLTAAGLGKRYGRRAALTGVDLDIPAGRIAGLVGPNGAGKSTLLGLAAGMLTPDEGSITVLGGRPGGDQLARVGFVAQDTPVYPSLSVADHLRLGARLNPRFDTALATARITALGLDPRQRAGRLSGGQRAQLALAIAAAKRPELLLFDEPVAALDPLARRTFLSSLMEFVADLGISVILSSHLIGDLERVCDYLIVLAAARVQVAGEVDDLLEQHVRIVGDRGDFGALPADAEVIQAEHGTRQSSMVVRSPGGVPGAEPLGLEDLVLAYLGRAVDRPLEVAR
ncbi:ABC transporter ATP-binding protein [Catenuloplanes sp. NPDC051500]|uniref:ABC transporter ATP-binding protein n=1 Tax=Catenuloplanes sp. NPDC051500 TaxID=3363959 RepID=UPI003797BFF5